MLQLIQFSMGHEKFLVYIWHKLLIFLSLNSVPLSVTMVSGSPSFDIKSVRGVLYMHNKHLSVELFRDYVMDLLLPQYTIFLQKRVLLGVLYQMKFGD